MVHSPPMPAPVTTPQRSRSSLLEIQAGIAHRLHAGGNAVVHELIHAARFLDAHVLLDGEAAHRAAEAGRECRDIKACDRADAAFAAQDRGPGIGHVAPDRAHQPETGDDYSAFTHEAPRTLRQQRRVRLCCGVR